MDTSTVQNPTSPLSLSLEKLGFFSCSSPQQLTKKNNGGFSRNYPVPRSFENLGNLKLNNDRVEKIPRDKSVIHGKTYETRVNDANSVSEQCEEIPDYPVNVSLGFQQSSLNEKDGLSLRNYILIISLTEPGSRCLQNILSLKNPSYTWEIFQGIIDNMFDVMTSKYGHFLFQKLIKSCNNTQLEIIIVEILNHQEKFVDACKDINGATSIKKLVRAVAKSNRLSITLSLIFSYEFYGLMRSKIRSSVVLSCLSFLDTKMNDVLYKVAIVSCIDLACNEVGCVSLNKFIDNSKGARREELLRKISEHSVFLAQDPFGNYVLQNVIDLHNPVVTELICTRLKGHYAHLSMQKSGSRVVERCISSPGRDYVFEELTNSSMINRLAKDQNGNYVLQTAMKVAKQSGSSFYEELFDKLEQNSSSLKHGYGKYLYLNFISTDSCSNN